MNSIISSSTILTMFRILSAFWLTGAILAPFLVSYQNSLLNKFGHFLYFIYKPTCHQIALRSLYIFESPVALCARCLFIYIGIFFCLLFYKFVITLTSKILFFLPLPFAIDILLEKIHIYHNLIYVRISTSFLFGLFVGIIFVKSLNIYKRN